MIKNIFKKFYKFSNSWTGTIIIVLLVIFFVAQAFVIPSGSMKRTLLIGDHLFVKKFSYGVPIPHLPWLEFPLLPDFRGNGHLINGESPKREDIVVFRYPLDPSLHYVKRCVAVGGDEIIYQDKAFYLRPHEGDTYIKENFSREKIVSLAGKLWIKNPYMDKYPGIHYSQDINLFAEMVKHLSINNLAMKPLNVDELPKQLDGVGFNAFYTKIPDGQYFMMGDNRDRSNDSRFWGAVKYRHIVGKPWFIYFSWNDNYEVRWDRVGRFISTIQSDANFINRSK